MRRKIVRVNAVSPQVEKPKEEKPKEEQPKVDNAKLKNDFLEVLYYQTKQRDGLLGEFSVDGKYSIQNEKILSALVDVPKLLQSKEDNAIYASTTIDGVVLNFKVELDIDVFYCTARLKFVEIEHRFDEDIKHIQELGEVVEPYSPLFVEHLLKIWHIVRTPEELDKNDFLTSYIQNQERNKMFMKELSDILAQLYIMRMLQLLNSCGEKGEKIGIEYKLLLEELIKKDPGATLDNLKLKSILDGLILKYDMLDVILPAGGIEIIQKYTEPINKIRGKEPDVVLVEKVEVKKESAKASAQKANKKSAAKKSDGKSSSGGGSKAKGKSGGDSKPAAKKTEALKPAFDIKINLQKSKTEQETKSELRGWTRDDFLNYKKGEEQVFRGERGDSLNNRLKEGNENIDEGSFLTNSMGGAENNIIDEGSFLTNSMEEVEKENNIDKDPLFNSAENTEVENNLTKKDVSSDSLNDFRIENHFEIKNVSNTKSETFVEMSLNK